MTGDKRGCLAAAPCLSKPPREQAISQVVSCLFLGVCNVGKGTVPVRGESRAQSPAAPAAAWALASGSVSILLCGHLLGASVSQCEVARCAVPQCVSPLNIPAPERLDSPCLLGDAGGSWGPASWNHRSPLPGKPTESPRQLSTHQHCHHVSYESWLHTAFGTARQWPMGLKPSLPTGSWQGPPGAQHLHLAKDTSQSDPQTG